MAKDGTNRGGARIGSGQKKKALADKILDGNPGNRKLTIMDFTDMTELSNEGVSILENAAHILPSFA